MWRGVGKISNKTLLERILSIIFFLFHFETKIFTTNIHSKGLRYEECLQRSTGCSRPDEHHEVAKKKKATPKQEAGRSREADGSLA